MADAVGVIRVFDQAIFFRRGGAGSASLTQASLANHSCTVRQIGQCTRPKNTGVALKFLRSVTMPVRMLDPVFGHLTMTGPIGFSLFFVGCVLHSAHV
jgi:hypothetical protein